MGSQGSRAQAGAQTKASRASRNQPEQALQPAKRGRRADAERNRAAIMEAAGAVFAEQGGTVDVREIARRSGVGKGTLYRHFPTKDDLLLTALEQQFDSWLTAAHQQATATEDPWQALTGFFEQMLTTQAGNRAVLESYTTNGGPTPSCAPTSPPTIWSCSAAP
ncbi:TetR/AcrR family transcriptional regulator [Streptomyces sp. TLI_185]|uniref:TetR/AcrR family transcriptional regulator n=1 Tax=Streptomyces sp. TLI_185 TaxID=2485151 RepID=UPI0021A7C217|nr:TetR/AcrR family transcriptional regulator [Streptomyces sp. TLI_185]